MVEKIVALDTTTYSTGWYELAELPQRRCKEIVLCGVVIYEDAQQVAVALMTDNEEETQVCSCFAVVPKGAVIKREVIKGE